MSLPRNKTLLGNARTLRREMTREERRLWYEFLRRHPLKFYRQKVLGDYIADFYCHQAKLVIELDGGQHYEPAGQQYDRVRTQALERMGLRVIRFSNLDVTRNFDGVCQQIQQVLDQRLPPAVPRQRQGEDQSG